MTKACLALVMAIGICHAEMVDRISVIVDGRLIKHSDIVKDIRLTSMLNHEPLTLELSARKSAAARLIDQALIRKELEAGLYPNPEPKDIDALLQQLRLSLGSEAAFRKSLEMYGITEQQLRQHLTWQLRVLRFVNVRFASGAQISDADVRAYYDQHLPELRRAGKSNITFESMRAEIEQLIAGERLNQQFFTWLDESGKNTPIVYNEEALK